MLLIRHFSSLLSLSRDISSFLPTGLEFSFKKFIHFFFVSGLGSLTSTIGRFDSIDARGIDPLTRHRVSNDILGAKAEAGVRIGRSLGKNECRLHPSSHMEIPCSCPFKQIPPKVKTGIWIFHIKLVVSILSGELIIMVRSCRYHLDEIPDTQVEC